MGPNFMDDIDCGNFFDQIDDLIEFPPENECGNGNLIGSGDCEDFPSMWTDSLPISDPRFLGSDGNPEPDLSAELSVPYEDIVQLEWLSTFVEDSFSSGGLTIGKNDLCPNKDHPVSQFHTSSPVSVLESSSSSSSCSGGKKLPVSPTHCRHQRARSKRSRPTTFNPRAAIELISPSPLFVETPHPFVSPGLESKDFINSGPLTKKIMKKKKIKADFPTKAVQTIPQSPAGQAVRKCLHCEITKTPQWRSGPLGPKTLCNACGVRYKSGRLFPEYRPAASPTFVPAVHSNSHKKVVEMRSKGAFGDVGTTGTVVKPEFFPTESN